MRKILSLTVLLISIIVGYEGVLFSQYPAPILQKRSRTISITDSVLVASDSIRLPSYWDMATVYILADTLKGTSPGDFWPGYHLAIQLSDLAGATRWGMERLAPRSVVDTLVFGTLSYVDLDSIMVPAEWLRVTVTLDSAPDSTFTLQTDLNFLFK